MLSVGGSVFCELSWGLELCVDMLIVSSSMSMSSSDREFVSASRGKRADMV